mmetsp:Transcript_8355/g.13514  ORF Transcript_8355/g.13514 Transcript_8355/m.13514 type:complete len:334 (-) Transcript_8355:250-1251(-)
MCGALNPSYDSSSSRRRSSNNGARGSLEGGTAPKDYRPEDCYISSLSQFTYGGESACAFGSLCFAEAFLKGFNPFGKDSKDVDKQFEALLSTAAKNFKDYFATRPRQHASPREILQSHSTTLYPNLKIKKWASSSIPSELQEVKSALVFPEALLPGGEIQLQNASPKHILGLLRGFSKRGVALGFVTIGYAFGVFCRSDGRFVVFDTHKKSFDKFGQSFTGKGGAYCALFSDALKAAKFIDNFSLDSRKSIMLLAQGMQQSQAASNIDIIAVISSSSSNRDDSKNAQSKDKTKKDKTIKAIGDILLPKPSSTAMSANESNTKDATSELDIDRR